METKATLRVSHTFHSSIIFKVRKLMCDNNHNKSISTDCKTEKIKDKLQHRLPCQRLYPRIWINYTIINGPVRGVPANSRGLELDDFNGLFQPKPFCVPEASRKLQNLACDREYHHHMKAFLTPTANTQGYIPLLCCLPCLILYFETKTMESFQYHPSDISFLCWHW